MIVIVNQVMMSWIHITVFKYSTTHRMLGGVCVWLELLNASADFPFAIYFGKTGKNILNLHS